MTHPIDDPRNELHTLLAHLFPTSRVLTVSDHGDFLLAGAHTFTVTLEKDSDVTYLWAICSQGIWLMSCQHRSLYLPVEALRSQLRTFTERRDESRPPLEGRAVTTLDRNDVRDATSAVSLVQVYPVLTQKSSEERTEPLGLVEDRKESGYE